MGRRGDNADLNGIACKGPTITPCRSRGRALPSPAQEELEDFDLGELHAVEIMVG
jgi:hypothetical protein